MEALLQQLMKMILALTTVISTIAVGQSATTSEVQNVQKEATTVLAQAQQVTQQEKSQTPVAPVAPDNLGHEEEEHNPVVQITVQGASVTVQRPKTQSEPESITETAPDSIFVDGQEEQILSDADQNHNSNTDTNQATEKHTSQPVAPTGSGADTQSAGGSSKISGEMYDYCGPNAGVSYVVPCARSEVSWTRTNVAQGSGPGTFSLTLFGDFDSDPWPEDAEAIEIVVDGISFGPVFDHNSGNDRFSFGGDIGNLQRSEITSTAQLSAGEIAQITADGTVNVTMKLLPGSHDDYSKYIGTEEYVKWELSY